MTGAEPHDQPAGRHPDGAPTRDGATGPPELLWQPSPERAEGSRMREFLDWLGEREGRTFADHATFQQWSVAHLERFWAAVWDYFDVEAHSTAEEVLRDREMPGAHWFPGARLSWAEHMLRYPVTSDDPDTADEPALLCYDEEGHAETVSWTELGRRVACLAGHLRSVGVDSGDRVVGYLPNTSHAVVGVLAAASIGAVWSCCSPDFGIDGAVSRLAQLDPVVLVTTDGYYWNGAARDRRATVAAVHAALPSLRSTVWVPYAFPDDPPPTDLGEVVPWGDVMARAETQPEPVAVDFSHPLWVLFSSGTTGTPKGLVHSHGGILLEHLKWFGLYADVRAGDRVFVYTTTGWMMWNALLAGLLHGSTLVLFDGNPGYPDAGTVWRIAADSRARILMLGAGLITASMKQEVAPARHGDLSALATVGVTGSRLPTEGFRWVYREVGTDVRLDSLSGGTDVCTAFVGGNELLPVRAGEISGVLTGVAAEARTPDGSPVTDEVGELCITAPMPSMPVRFWNDPDGQRYADAYFDTWPEVWAHGDWVTLTSRGSVVIHGRSDATLNRHGVRMGSGEFYDVVEAMPEVAEALVVGVELTDGGYHLPLFVTPADGITVDETLQQRIRDHLRTELSPRHVPDAVVPAPAVPHTLSGKKLEVPVKRLFQGVTLEQACSLGAIDDPDAMRWYAEHAAAFRGQG